jgi:hypothetical protein
MGTKIHGGPLQTAFQTLSRLPEAPAQAEVLRKLHQTLQKKGVSYHPRTIKRQLQGDIEYIPPFLEETFFAWLREAFPKLHDQLQPIHQREKSRLAQSHDGDLYVAPGFFLEMADAYLFRHKDLSRRRLALALKDSMAQKGFPLGLETLQAALSGKTQKVRKVVEDQLLEYFLQEGFSARSEVESFLAAHRGTDVPEVTKVDVGETAKSVEAFLLKVKGFTKRQLALHLKNRLTEKGYVYHLSSLQSILEGNTRKTRKVVLDTLQEIFASEGVEAGPSLSPDQLHWNHYVDATDVPEKVRRLTELHPRLTRRQIASLLREDLAKRNFSFSLNTLQFILSGKTKRVKKVVAELLEEYLADPDGSRWQVLQAAQSLSRKGRHSPDRRVLEAFTRFQQSEGAERETFRKEFLAARAELIRHRWEKRKQPTRVYQKYSEAENWNGNWENPPEQGYPAGDDPDVSYSVDLSLRKLVS